MRNRIATLVLCLTFLVAGTASKVACSAERPNVLFIAIDDLNDWVGCLHAHPNAKTPNIDALARRGTLFTNAHCQAPICGPSRASLLSGKYPHSTGAYQQPGKPGLQSDSVHFKGQLLPDLRLLIRRKNIQNSVDRLHARIGMQGRENQVARLGDDQSRFHCFQITHLSN